MHNQHFEVHNQYFFSSDPVSEPDDRIAVASLGMLSRTIGTTHRREQLRARTDAAALPNPSDPPSDPWI